MKRIIYPAGFEEFVNKQEQDLWDKIFNMIEEDKISNKEKYYNIEKLYTLIEESRVLMNIPVDDKPIGKQLESYKFVILNIGKNGGGQTI